MGAVPRRPGRDPAADPHSDLSRPDRLAHSLVSAANKDILASARTLDDLRRLRFGQRQDWADTPILRANGLEVKTSQNYESLFRMLDAGRFEVFPREVVVIDGELEDASRAGLHLAIDQHVALHYPAAFYFFVSRQRPELAEAIRQGLEKAIADGSFERLFERHFKTRLGKLALRQRRIIELKTPIFQENSLSARGTLVPAVS